MATAGVLQLLFTTDASGLSKGVSKARTEVVEFGSVVQETGSKISGLWAGLGAAVSVGGLAAFAKSGMDSANATRVLAEQLGTSTEALSRLQYAAKISDVPLETLGGSLQKMQLRLGEIATTGEGKAAGVLERMGLDAAALAEQDPAKTFHQLLAVIEQIPNPAERMKVAIDLFGKSASGILNFALQGSKGIADMEAEADRLGVTLSGVDAAKIDEADDAMTRIWETIGGLGKTLAVELAPYLTAVSKGFLDMGTAGVDSTGAIGRGVEAVAVGIGYVLDAVQVLRIGLLGFRSVFADLLDGMVKQVGFLVKAFDLAGQALGVTGGAATAFVDKLSEELVASRDADWAKAGELMARPWADAAAKEFFAKAKAEGAAGAAAAAARAAQFTGGMGAGIEPGKGKPRDWTEIEDHVDRAEEKGRASFAKAMEFGSAEAANAVLRSRFGGEGSGLDRISENTRRQAELAQQQLDVMREIAARSGLAEDVVWSEFERS